ncbi:MAG: FAD-dependent oxidoreductase [Oscillospiraceae bacterium]|nr:FAD-dependent oxidoreductase [Oscillospiraceae bacterium]
MAKSAWAKFATYISFHGGLFLGPMNDGAPFVEMFRLLISEEECELGMHIPTKPTSVEEIAAAAKLPVEKTAELLKHMSQKGACFERITRDGKCFYNITPFIPGFYEFVMTDPETKKNKEVAFQFRRTLNELGVLLRNVSVQGGGLMKVTPVMKEISAQQKVYSFEDVLTFVNNAHTYSVADCACRTAAKLVGKGCDHPIEGTCMQFDETADYYVRTGRGRYVTKEEAIEILEYTEKSGLVHCAFQVEGKDYTTFICNCCGCACAGLRQINRLDANPMSHSNFRAKIDNDKCVACGECVTICPMNAVTMGTSFDCAECQTREYRKAQNTILRKGDVHDDFINERNLTSPLGTAPCKVACPAHISVQGYIQKAAEGKYLEALEVIKKDNPLPAVCGRICPHPCEKECTRNTLDQSLAIDAIKMFIADQEREKETRFVPEKKASYDNKVAVVGSGPAGLSCAYYLAVDGFRVTVFEKSEKPGGMLMMGIPSFRLEKEVIESEIEVLRDLGVEFRCGVEVGKDVSLAALREQGFEAFYLAIGAQKSSVLRIPGEELEGVYGGVDFLRNINSGLRPVIGKTCAVIGGGNVAMDVCRSAVRLGAKTYIVYRRTAEEMPADPEEVSEAMSEGVEFRYLNAPVEIVGKNGKVKALKVEIMKLGEPDEKGRRAPVGTGEFEEIKVDSVIAAIGQTIDWGELDTGAMVKGKKLNAEANELSFQTAESDIFVGGDCLTGPKFAIDGIAHGKEGAISISRLLRGRNLTDARNGRYQAVDTDNVKLGIRNLNTTPRQQVPEVDGAVSSKTFEDLRAGLTEEQIKKEALRCLHCGQSIVDPDKCIGCGVCTHRCEFDAIHLVRVDDTQWANDMSHWYGRLAKNVVKRGANIVAHGISELVKRN